MIEVVRPCPIQQGLRSGEVAVSVIQVGVLADRQIEAPEDEQEDDGPQPQREAEDDQQRLGCDGWPPRRIGRGRGMSGGGCHEWAAYAKHRRIYDPPAAPSPLKHWRKPCGVMRR